MRFGNSKIYATILLKINLLKIKNYMHSHNREIATLLLVENIAEHFFELGMAVSNKAQNYV